MSGKNTKPTKAKNLEKKKEQVTVKSEAQQNLEKNATFVDYRTLDFSSVGLFSSKSTSNEYIGRTLTNDRFALKKDLYTDSLRRWHQMTLYIENSYMHRQSKSQSSQNSQHNYVICSNLPDSFSYQLEAAYAEPLKMLSQVSEALNLGMQFATKGAASTKMKVADIRIWTGGKPLVLKLSIPIMDDAWFGANANGVGTNFNEALEILSSMCLPLNETHGNNGVAKLFSQLSYTPPPNPLEGTIKYKEKVKNSKTGVEQEVDRSSSANTNKGHIHCQLGGMLYARNCVLTSMQVEYPNTKAMICHDYPKGRCIADNALGEKGTGSLKYLTPIMAKLNLTLETPFIMTQENYEDMLWLGQNVNAASYTLDTTQVADSITGAAKSLANGTKNILKG